EPIAAGSVVAVWYESYLDTKGYHRERREGVAKADGRGWYAICRPAADPFSARAESGRDSTGFVEIAVEAQRVTITDFLLARRETAARAPAGDTITAARGTARITGTVKTKTGRTVAGAEVSVAAGARATTSDAGAFALDGVAPGTQGVDVRAIGFAPTHVAVALVPGATSTVAIVLGEKVAELERVTVLGEPKTTMGAAIMQGFAERMRFGIGRFLTAEDIERRQPQSACSVFYTVPGLLVSQSRSRRGVSSASCSIAMRSASSMGSCAPIVYLDGLPIAGGSSDLDLILRPDQVFGIEVYRGPAEIPARFNATGSSCGIILIWHKWQLE
ncbi:MAG: TonB-dependent receptor, partial [Gemmatimonadaceae bacterium]